MRYAVILLGIILVSGCARTYRSHYASPAPAPGCCDVGTLTDKDAVVETINQLFVSTDQRDWDRVVGLFAPKVLFDMTSLSGGKPVLVSPHDIVDLWDKGLKGLQAVHHQSGNFIVAVNGAEADAFCYALASHYLPTVSGRNTRTFAGSYDVHLKKQDGVWWIDRFKFNLQYIDGNKNLEKEAAE